MPQVFHVIRCFSCTIFQVHQVKKVLKFICKMCGQKQSIKKVYNEGAGAECRQHVQHLNRLRGEVESRVADEADGHGEPTAEVSRAPESVPPPPGPSKWAQYVASLDCEGAPPGSDSDDCEDMIVTTSRPDLARRRKRIRRLNKTDKHRSHVRQAVVTQIPDPTGVLVSMGTNSTYGKKAVDAGGSSHCSNVRQSLNVCRQGVRHPFPELADDNKDDAGAHSKDDPGGAVHSNERQSTGLAETSLGEAGSDNALFRSDNNCQALPSGHLKNVRGMERGIRKRRGSSTPVTSSKWVKFLADDANSHSDESEAEEWGPCPPQVATRQGDLQQMHEPLGETSSRFLPDDTSSHSEAGEVGPPRLMKEFCEPSSKSCEVISDVRRSPGHSEATDVSCGFTIAHPAAKHSNGPAFLEKAKASHLVFHLDGDLDDLLDDT